MTEVYILKYAHKGKGFDGWYDIAVFQTKENAEKALEDERVLFEDFNYKIDTIKFI